MPRQLFTAATKKELLRLEVDRVLTDTLVAGMLARRLAVAFQVSCQAAMIRLKTLEVLASPGQNYLV